MLGRNTRPPEHSAVLDEARRVVQDAKELAWVAIELEQRSEKLQFAALELVRQSRAVIEQSRRMLARIASKTSGNAPATRELKEDWGKPNRR